MSRGLLLGGGGGGELMFPPWEYCEQSSELCAAHLCGFYWVWLIWNRPVLSGATGDKEHGCGGSYRPGCDCRMKYCRCVLDSFVHTSGFFFNYWCEGRGTATVANWTVFWSETLTSFITYFLTVHEQFHFHPAILIVIYEGRSGSKFKMCTQRSSEKWDRIWCWGPFFNFEVHMTHGKQMVHVRI